MTLFLKELRKSIILNAVFALLGAVIFTVCYEASVVASVYGTSGVIKYIGLVFAGVFVLWIARRSGVMDFVGDIRLFARWLYADAAIVAVFAVAGGFVFLKATEALAIALPIGALCVGFLMARETSNDVADILNKIRNLIAGTFEKSDR
jgi:hypothetical protein